jgi:hypothetical protein
LIGDFNAHTGNVSEYVVIDNNILDVLNLQDDDKKNSCQYVRRDLIN